MLDELAPDKVVVMGDCTDICVCTLWLGCATATIRSRSRPIASLALIRNSTNGLGAYRENSRGTGYQPLMVERDLYAPRLRRWRAITRIFTSAAVAISSRPNSSIRCGDGGVHSAARPALRYARGAGSLAASARRGSGGVELGRRGLDRAARGRIADSRALPAVRPVRDGAVGDAQQRDGVATAAADCVAAADGVPIISFGARTSTQRSAPGWNTRLLSGDALDAPLRRGLLSPALRQPGLCPTP